MTALRRSAIPRRKTVFVLAHDAGGAEILAAYMRRYGRRTHFAVYAGGPAQAICKRERISCRPEPKRTELRNVIKKHKGALALLGTGGFRSIELAALKEAKRQGMKTAVYIDSWTNYRERFGYPARSWQKNLPDEIWVGDVHARSLARRYFAVSRVRLVPNQYFAAIAARYRARVRAVRKPHSILYASAAGRLSEKLLAAFLGECSRRKFIIPVRVRMHPENNRSKFLRIIRLYGRGVRVELSHTRDIAADLLRAHVIVGPETNALVAAFLSGVRTIRIVPEGSRSYLPFKKIVRVKSAKAAAKLIF